MPPDKSPELTKIGAAARAEDFRGFASQFTPHFGVSPAFYVRRRSRTF